MHLKDNTLHILQHYHHLKSLSRSGHVILNKQNLQQFFIPYSNWRPSNMSNKIKSRGKRGNTSIPGANVNFLIPLPEAACWIGLHALTTAVDKLGRQSKIRTSFIKISLPNKSSKFKVTLGDSHDISQVFYECNLKWAFCQLQYSR